MIILALVGSPHSLCVCTLIQCAYVHVYIHVLFAQCVRVCVCVCVGFPHSLCVCTLIQCAYVHVYVHVLFAQCVRVCVCVCVCVCMEVHTTPLCASSIIR